MRDIKVAIVEDTDLIRKSLCTTIEEAIGYQLIAAYASAEDALDDITTKEVDVVLMDINLPGINGIDCMKKLNSLNYKTQFLMCTVYEDDEKVFEALKAGATGYIASDNRITPGWLANEQSNSTQSSSLLYTS